MPTSRFPRKDELSKLANRLLLEPAEWAWRRLTYGGPQPLRLTPDSL